MYFLVVRYKIIRSTKTFLCHYFEKLHVTFTCLVSYSCTAPSFLAGINSVLSHRLLHVRCQTMSPRHHWTDNCWKHNTKQIVIWKCSLEVRVEEVQESRNPLHSFLRVAVVFPLSDLPHGNCAAQADLHSTALNLLVCFSHWNRPACWERKTREFHSAAVF